jgi:hypothetical protein
VWFRLDPEDELGRQTLLRCGCVYDPSVELWSAQPPATPLRSRFGCVPNPYLAHDPVPVDRGYATSISDLMAWMSQ